jgi:hypothetical protein
MILPGPSTARSGRRLTSAVTTGGVHFFMGIFCATPPPVLPSVSVQCRVDYGDHLTSIERKTEEGAQGFD